MYLSKSTVELIDHMGSDLTVVNSARVSFNKTVSKFTKKDEELIRYLATNEHWTPFAHCIVQLRIKAPIFVARQLDKHQIGLVKNEVSRRYVDTAPEFFFPTEWRKKHENKKQGSSDETINISHIETQHIQNIIQACAQLYNDLLQMGTCPEQARMILPQNMITEWYWTGSLSSFARVCNLRLKQDAQKETREVAEQIDKICSELFPISWKYLIRSK